MLHTGLGQALTHGVATVPAIELPQELGSRAQLLGRHAGFDADAVNADVCQFGDEVRVGAALMAVGVAVDVHVAAHDVHLHRWRVFEPTPHRDVQFAQLVLDERMSGRVESNEPSQRDKLLHHDQRIGATLGDCGRVHGRRGSTHRFSTAPASRAARTSGRFQNR